MARVQVYRNLAMPTFDATTLGLLGMRFPAPA